MPKASETLDDISHEHAPSRWLEEAAAQPRPAQQLGTLGGGNHFLEVLHSYQSVMLQYVVACSQLNSWALLVAAPTSLRYQTVTAV